jgi:capsular exopolysaccharide synthesis family protein
VALDKQIAMTRSHLDSLLNLGGEGGEPKDLLDVYLDSMRYEIGTIQLQLTQLGEMFEDENKKARALDTELTRDRQLREEIQRKASLLEVVIKRLDEMSLFSTQGIRTQVIAEPAQGVQTPEERAKHMAIGGALGLLFVSILAYLLESNDKSFRSPEDIRDELGLSVLGHVPVIANKAVAAGSTASPALCTVHLPKGQSSEAFRLVRTALFFGARSGNMKIIQVTSPDQGDGKSTVSANLAVAIAQSGRKTLLIDADMRRPTVHRLFGLSNDFGTADVIAEQLDPADAIHKSQVSNLSIMVCGPRPHNPAELLASHQFDEFLSWARDNYDFVIIDTPPLLAVSDPGNVASRVDGVMLALRLGKRARAKGNEARDILERVGANILGIIINGVNARGEYGYQSGYRYTAASTARYGYGETYFSNDHADDERQVRRSVRHVNGHATPSAAVKDT